jgi:hypothetical protein
MSNKKTVIAQSKQVDAKPLSIHPVTDIAIIAPQQAPLADQANVSQSPATAHSELKTAEKVVPFRRALVVQGVLGYVIRATVNDKGEITSWHANALTEKWALNSKSKEGVVKGALRHFCKRNNLSEEQLIASWTEAPVRKTSEQFKKKEFKNQKLLDSLLAV